MSLVRACLKRLHSPDVYDLDSYRPTDESRFALQLQAFFGPEGSEGEESFDLVVCTPGWLAQKVEQERVISGRHYLIVNEYNIEEIRTFLVRYATRCPGRTWNEVAEKLARIGLWEFEDYTE